MIYKIIIGHKVLYTFHVYSTNMVLTNSLQESIPDVIRAVSFAQEFSDRPVYSIKEDAVPLAGSLFTAYRRLHILESYNLAKLGRNQFEIKTDVVSQPLHVLKKLLPSLIALKNAKRFGKYYTESDIIFARKNIPGQVLTTLDYAAWDITKYQTPSNLYVYVNDLDTTSKFLKEESGFSEGNNGRVVLLPLVDDFTNKIERVYLDCVANGGRSSLDAIAIELQYGDQLTTRAHFPIEYVKKVQEESNRSSRYESISA